MTREEFTAFYPQFVGFAPDVVLSEYVRRANARFSSFTAEDSEEARRLYTAHKLTLYARTALPDEAPPDRSAIAAAGQSYRRIASKKVGEVSVAYAAGASDSAVSAELAELTETDFGMQLLSLLRLYRLLGYVP